MIQGKILEVCREILKQNVALPIGSCEHLLSMQLR